MTHFEPFPLLPQVLKLRDLPILALSAEVGAKIKEEAIAGQLGINHLAATPACWMDR